MANTNKLIYLHGFNSSPDSHKAVLLQAAMEEKNLGERLVIPAIPPEPDLAIKMLLEIAEDVQKSHEPVFSGSSLGGFYATWLAEHFKSKAVLINPAVQPHILLAKYLGENVNYHTSERWILEDRHIEDFRNAEVRQITQPENYLVLLQKGDETLDYRQAAEKYAACNLEIEEGGDHSFVDFEKHIDKLLGFLEIID